MKVSERMFVSDVNFLTIPVTSKCFVMILKIKLLRTKIFGFLKSLKFKNFNKDWNLTVKIWTYWFLFESKFQIHLVLLLNSIEFCEESELNICLTSLTNVTIQSISIIKILRWILVTIESQILSLWQQLFPPSRQNLTPRRNNYCQH